MSWASDMHHLTVPNISTKSCIGLDWCRTSPSAGCPTGHYNFCWSATLTGLCDTTVHSGPLDFTSQKGNTQQQVCITSRGMHTEATVRTQHQVNKNTGTLQGWWRLSPYILYFHHSSFISHLVLNFLVDYCFYTRFIQDASHKLGMPTNAGTQWYIRSWRHLAFWWWKLFPQVFLSSFLAVIIIFLKIIGAIRSRFIQRQLMGSEGVSYIACLFVGSPGVDSYIYFSSAWKRTPYRWQRCS